MFQAEYSKGIMIEKGLEPRQCNGTWGRNASNPKLQIVCNSAFKLSLCLQGLAIHEGFEGLVY